MGSVREDPDFLYGEDLVGLALDQNFDVEDCHGGHHHQRKAVGWVDGGKVGEGAMGHVENRALIERRL